jgi:hypothetical protein
VTGETADRLYEINRQLTGLYVELTEVRKAEAAAFDAGYFDSGATSAVERKQYGRRNALPHYLDGLDLRAKIEALQEERDYLRFTVEHGYG